MTCIHLATALVRRADAVLLVASQYPNHDRPLWNMPGGRQQTGELLTQTVLRELAEETGMTGMVRELCYVSESYDGQTHFTNVTFGVDAIGEPAKLHSERDHIVDAAWVAIDARSAVTAANHPEWFTMYGVGLVSVSPSGDVEPLITPGPSRTRQPGRELLAERAAALHLSGQVSGPLLRVFGQTLVASTGVDPRLAGAGAH